MPTILDMASGVYFHLGDPPKSALKFHVVLEKLRVTLQQFQSKLNSSDRLQWLASYDFSVAINVEQYSIDAIENFGGELWLERLANDTSDKNTVPIELVSNINAADKFAMEGRQAAFIFINPSDNSRQIRFKPAPQEAQRFRLWYEIGLVGTTALADTPVFPAEWLNLVKIETAIACYPDVSDWLGARSAAFIESLNIKRIDMREDFDKWMNKTRGARRRERRGFGGNRLVRSSTC